MLCIVTIPGCAPAAQRTGTIIVAEGQASYYGDEFEGRRTANGEAFSQADRTAAHRTYPFGTILRVTNLANGRETTVRVNDRGPFRAERIIDLSKAAAADLDMIRSGVASVRITVIQWGRD